MNVLTLSIRQKPFDDIMSGEKTQEFREIRPSTQKKYCELDEEGYCKFDEENGVFVPKQYDAIKFFTGAYNKPPRPWALVEVKGANIELFVDENDEFIKLEEKGETYYMAQIVYDLGRILERS